MVKTVRRMLNIALLLSCAIGSQNLVGQCSANPWRMAGSDRANVVVANNGGWTEDGFATNADGEPIAQGGNWKIDGFDTANDGEVLAPGQTAARPNAWSVSGFVTEPDGEPIAQGDNWKIDDFATQADGEPVAPRDNDWKIDGRDTNADGEPVDEQELNALLAQLEALRADEDVKAPAASR